METNNQLAIKKQAPVVMRREMAKNPVVLGALNALERTVFLASTAKTIAEYDANELAVELKSTLRWICKDVGYRITDESEMQYTIIRTTEILKRYYSSFTLKDMRMAFDMLIAGELDDFLPKGSDGQPDRKHYQQFNAEYTCKVLNAYRTRRALVLKKAHDAIPKKERAVDPSMRDEYRRNSIRELIAHFGIFKDTGILSTSPLLDLIFYNILCEYGLAPEVEVLPEEQRYVWQQSINDFAKRGMLGDMNRLKQEGPTAPELENAAYSKARHRALRKAFRDIIEQGLQVQDIIKTE